MEQAFSVGLAELEALEDGVGAQEVPDGLVDVAVYQRATLDYGLASHRFALEWLRTVPR